MADSSVSYVIQKLGELLLNEAIFLKGVREQVERLQDELRRMQSFLVDADEKQAYDNRVRYWVSDIRKVAYDTEDLIDTFILKIESQKRRGFIKRYACIPKEWVRLHNFGKEIEAIQARVGDISRRPEAFGIQNLGEGTSSTLRESLRQMRRFFPRELEKDIVGLEEDTEMLVERLVKNEDRLCVIAIVGMGGTGKTTLAKKVYNHSEVRIHFDCHAWTYVSQEYRPIDVLQRIIKELVKKPTKELLEMIENSPEQDLENMIYEHLQGRRYLVVVDDIWSRDVWPSLARAFPNTSNGKVMLTTRIRDVAWHADVQSIHEPRLLSDKDGWKLFCQKAFIDSVDAKVHPELDDVGKQIVNKCYGLPLAITVMGGLLSRKKKLRIEWERVLDKIDSFFVRGFQNILPILAFSYYDLPHYLKSCFLHLGHFPKGYVITTRKLFHLWVAEGLIPQRGGRMEDIAEDYLNELINRNMVQVVRISADERIKQCRIHDLLRYLAISKAKEEICLDIIHGDLDLPRSAETRYQAVYSGPDWCFDSQPSTPHLRSLLFFQPRESIAGKSLDFICKSFRLLRVLDLGDSSLFYLPSEIGKLIHLRYLGLQGNHITELSSSMCYLRTLQTLDIRTLSDTMKIPNVICKMENLRHLYMNGALQDDAQLKIDTLRHLQTLSRIDVRNWKVNNSENLTSLRKLGINVSIDLDGEEFFNSIAELECLSSPKLNLSPSPYCQFLPSLTGLSHLHGLTKLYLKGMMRKLPSPHEFPPNLTQLTLHFSYLQQGPMEVLGMLPKLSILRLRAQSYIGQTLAFSANEFLQLNFLELKELYDLRELKVEEGAMLRLTCLQISSCGNLAFSSEGRKFLSDLEELEIDGMPQEIRR